MNSETIPKGLGLPPSAAVCGFRMSPTRSQTMALPLTTSEWLDPLADLTNNGPTGLEPLSKTVHFYKRSWTSGKPFSHEPSWADMSHIPPARRRFSARPDLALNAMHAILGRVEQELYHEAEVRESQRLRRQDRIERLRNTHEKSHALQRKIGVAPPPKHHYAEHARQRAQSPQQPPQYLQQPLQPQLDASASSLASIPPTPTSTIPPTRGGRLSPPPALTSATTVILPSNADKALYGEFGEGRPLARAPSPLMSEVYPPSSPLLAMRSQKFAGLEGLLIPKYPAPGEPGATHTADGRRPPSPPHASCHSSHGRLLSSTPSLPAAALMAAEPAGGRIAELATPANTSPGRSLSRPTTAGSGSRLPSNGQADGYWPKPALRHSPSYTGTEGDPYGGRPVVGSPRPVPCKRAAAREAPADHSSLPVAHVPPLQLSASAASFLWQADRPRLLSSEPAFRLGWVESYGGHLGKPPRRSPFHFEAGLSNNVTPLPRPFSAASLIATAATPAASRANLLAPSESVLVQTASKSQLHLYTSGTAPIPAASQQLLHNSRGPLQGPAPNAAPPIVPAYSLVPARTNRPRTAAKQERATASGAPRESAHDGVPPSPDTISRAARALAY